MSFLNFKGCKITVVTTATDLRAGYFRLEAFARSTLNIDICSGHHCVVFLSRTRALAKIIAADQSGMTLITRRLHHGSFQQLMSLLDSPAKRSLTAEQLVSFLNGKRIEGGRKNYFKEQ